ncbi:MAG: BON domain-containing protein [Desulfovibrionaceae bacterium]
MRNIFRLLIALLALSALGGCTAYKVAVDERSVGQIYDDEAITFQIEKEFLADDNVNYLDFKAFSYLGNVYVVGEYETEAQRDRAVAIARSFSDVRSVSTYLLPKVDVAGCSTTESLRISAQLDKELLEDKYVTGTNVDTKLIQCRAVLLGLVGSQSELDRAVSIASQIPGVRQVKSFLRVYRGN